MPAPSLPAGYRLLDGAPTVEDYLRLRVEAGLSPRRPDQARAGLAGSWASVRVVQDADGTVGMGRAIGDGGCNFHLLDMAVLPAHQRRGLGDAILTELLARIRAAALPAPTSTCSPTRPEARSTPVTASSRPHRARSAWHSTSTECAGDEMIAAA